MCVEPLLYNRRTLHSAQLFYQVLLHEHRLLPAYNSSSSPTASCFSSGAVMLSPVPMNTALIKIHFQMYLTLIINL